MANVTIAGVASSIPEKVVTNKELESLVETSDEWITKRTGIHTRHVVVGETATGMAADSAAKALEMSGVPKEIDETAYIDGYSFPKFFVKIFIPLIGSGIGVTAFFCFMFSWVELLLARTLTSVNAKPIAAVMTRTVSASGIDWGVLAAAGVLTILPGMLVIWFVRNHVAKGFALGRV